LISKFTSDIFFIHYIIHIYITTNRPGPSSPLSWIEGNIRRLTPTSDFRDKILAGVNFYGNDFISGGGGGAIIGKEQLRSLNYKMFFEFEIFHFLSSLLTLIYI